MYYTYKLTARLRDAHLESYLIMIPISPETFLLIRNNDESHDAAVSSQGGYWFDFFSTRCQVIFLLSFWT